MSVWTTRARSAIKFQDSPWGGAGRSSTLTDNFLLARTAAYGGLKQVVWQAEFGELGTVFFFLGRKSTGSLVHGSIGDASKSTKQKKQRGRRHGKKKTHSYTAGSVPPQGQGSGRRSVADNARFG